MILVIFYAHFFFKLKSSYFLPYDLPQNEIERNFQKENVNMYTSLSKRFKSVILLSVCLSVKMNLPLKCVQHLEFSNLKCFWKSYNLLCLAVLRVELPRWVSVALNYFVSVWLTKKKYWQKRSERHLLNRICLPLMCRSTHMVQSSLIDSHNNSLGDRSLLYRTPSTPQQPSAKIHFSATSG